jgi:hypothetical protein
MAWDDVDGYRWNGIQFGIKDEGGSIRTAVS